MARTFRRVVIRLVLTLTSAAPVSAQARAHSPAHALGQAPSQATAAQAAPATSSSLSQIEVEAVGWLQNLVRINTTNPPGNELVAAKYLAGVLDQEGIHSETFESTPGRGFLVARLSASAKRIPQRKQADDERERGHENRPQSHTRSVERRIDYRGALLELSFGELDDQDRILGGETDQHDETDLGVDIVVEIA